MARPWVAIEGSSSDPYVPKNVICQLDPRPLSLPQELQERKAAIEKRTDHDRANNRLSHTSQRADISSTRLAEDNSAT